MRIVLAGSAEFDGNAAWEWFNYRDPALAQRFESRIRQALELLLEFPEVGTWLPENKKMVRLRPFEYDLFTNLMAMQ